MKIYTRTGDRGETGLVGGQRIAKSDPRVAAYGDVDELNAQLGAARSASPEAQADDLLDAVQRDLFAIGAWLATPGQDGTAPTTDKTFIDAERITALERAIDEADKELEPLRSFVLPTGTPAAAAFHVARTVCRRAERSVVALSRQEPVSDLLLVYLNRLSDLLFTLARRANAREGHSDTLW